MKWLIVLALFLFIIPAYIEARQGCCSWHGGVCGARCCDGTALSAKCRGSGGTGIRRIRVIHTPTPTPNQFSKHLDSFTQATMANGDGLLLTLIGGIVTYGIYKIKN